MIGLLFAALKALGLSERVARWVAPALLVVAAVGLLAGVYGLIRHGGEKAGAAKVETRVARQHSAAVAEARQDERVAQAATDRISAATVRRDVATAAATRSTIEDLHHAFDAVPPAAAADCPPPAPVDGLRASLNAAIARANRAAEAPGAAGGDNRD